MSNPTSAKSRAQVLLERYFVLSNGLRRHKLPECLHALTVSLELDARPALRAAMLRIVEDATAKNIVPAGARTTASECSHCADENNRSTT